MALDDYFSDPSQDCLARLFDAINSMDFSAAPSLTRHEKLIMRNWPRPDLFSEKFAPPPLPPKLGSTEMLSQTTDYTQPAGGGLAPNRHRSTVSWDSRTSFDDGIVMREKTRDRAGTESNVLRAASSQGLSQPTKSTDLPTPPEDTFSTSDSSAGWTGNDNGSDGTAVGLLPNANGAPLSRRPTLGRGRRSTDASNSSNGDTRDHAVTPLPTMNMGSSSNAVKDTREFVTSIQYKDFQLPIKMPLTTFPEEVGDVSVAFSNTTVIANSCLSVFADPTHSNLFVP